MRIAITGASGNAGSALIEALAGEDRVESILGIARRIPRWRPEKVEWAAADVASADLRPLFESADAVVHLAWAIQPSRDLAATTRTNVTGSERVFRAAAETGVESLIYASSVGAYSPGPKDRAAGEDWPTDGIATSFYSRHKAQVERLLDRLEAESALRVVRLRPGLIFRAEAGSEIRRLFAGPLLPSRLVDRRLIGIVPRIPGLRFQAVHSRDVGDAYRLALLSDVRGAFNIAAEPVLDPERIAEFLGARTVPVPARAIRALASLSWRLRLQPTPPGWLDMALAVPIMDTTRARSELGWEPSHSGLEALGELIEGMKRGQGIPTPPLQPDDQHSRLEELRSGVGSRGPSS